MNRGLSYVTKAPPSNKQIADRRDTQELVNVVTFSNKRLPDLTSNSARTPSYDAKVPQPTNFQAQKN